MPTLEGEEHRVLWQTSKNAFLVLDHRPSLSAGSAPLTAAGCMGRFLGSRAPAALRAAGRRQLAAQQCSRRTAESPLLDYLDGISNPRDPILVLLLFLPLMHLFG